MNGTLFEVRPSRIAASERASHAIPKRGLLALSLAFALPLATANAQQPPPGAGITGTWNHQLTIRNCSTGAALAQGSSISSYVPGGVIVEVNPSPNPALRTPGLGTWKYVGGRRYEMSLKFYRYNADATFAGKTLIDSDITHLLNDTLSQVAVIRIFNSAGVQVASGCATLASARFTGDE
jgi:hypothetical protein